MTTTSSTSAASGNAILTALNATGGLDTGNLVTSLVSATYDPKTAALKVKETANTAKISQLGTLTSGIDAFSTALQTLISGGTLSTQPVSSNSAVLTATAKAGAQIGSLSAQLSVRQVAQAQSLVSGYYASSGTAIGAGTLTLGVAGKSVDITIDSSNNTLAGVARAINLSGAGVTAAVVSDANGARLTLKGDTGAANAFTLGVSANSDAGLAALTYGTTSGMTVSGSEALSPVYADAAATPIGQGSFTLTGPNGTATVTIDATTDNLTGLGQQINASGTGLTASVVTDPNGYRLSITDGSGNPPTYTLTPASGAQAGLASFTYPTPSSSPSLTRAQAAQDAIIRMDGVDVTRASNTVDDLIDGVTLKLVSAAPTETVSLTATRPTSAINQAVQDFVAAYNEMKTQIDTATAAAVTASDGTVSQGALYGNSAIRQMQSQLSRLPSTILNTSGGPQTLADIGVKTNRDGTLTVDTTALTKALNTYPDAVEAMFNPTQHASSPLIKITSAMGATKPGTFTLTNIVAGTSSTAASGTIDGNALLTTGTGLYAPVAYKAASGLSFEPQGDIASVTITVDLGLGGALQAIRDSLRSTGGILASLSSSLDTEKTDLSDQRLKIEDAQSNYQDQLTKQFATMNTRVSNYSAIKSYLTQQIAVWTKDNN